LWSWCCYIGAVDVDWATFIIDDAATAANAVALQRSALTGNDPSKD